MKKVFLSLITFLLICCCGSAAAFSIYTFVSFSKDQALNQTLNQKYGIAYNSERKKIGLPIIPNDWTYTNSAWTNPKSSELFKNRIPYHESKFILDNKGVLIYEEDVYYGSQDYNDVGGFDRGRDELSIKYCYRVDQQDYDCSKKSGWHILFLSQKSFDTFTYDKLNIDEAKKILNDWGLTYP